MNKLLQAVAAKTYQLCRTYPGGIRAMFAGMRERLQRIRLAFREGRVIAC